MVRYLVKHGYSDEEIEKVLGRNILRVLKQVWK
ncbi:membrane dipeptidase [Clostridioides difficile]|nr:membrane dipeptidase [Clostridioides difficile]